MSLSGRSITLCVCAALGGHTMWRQPAESFIHFSKLCLCHSTASARFSSSVFSSSSSSGPSKNSWRHVPESQWGMRTARCCMYTYFDFDLLIARTAYEQRFRSKSAFTSRTL